VDGVLDDDGRDPLGDVGDRAGAGAALDLAAAVGAVREAVFDAAVDRGRGRAARARVAGLGPGPAAARRAAMTASGPRATRARTGSAVRSPAWAASMRAARAGGCGAVAAVAGVVERVATGHHVPARFGGRNT